MQIDWPVIRQQAIKRGVIMTHVAVRDFDHNDQVQPCHAGAHALPELYAVALCSHEASTDHAITMTETA